MFIKFKSCDGIIHFEEFKKLLSNGNNIEINGYRIDTIYQRSIINSIDNGIYDHQVLIDVIPLCVEKKENDKNGLCIK